MTTISSAGVGSGLDVETIITKLMAVERQPVTQLQTKATAINSQISSWGKVKSAMSTLNDAADVLAKASTWKTRTVTASDTSALSATVTGEGLTGKVSVRPTQLAAAQSVASAGFTSKTDTVGAGTLTIQLGTWTSDTAFTGKTDSSALTVSVDASDTLEKVRDKVNAADAGVTASIVNDGSAYRLVFTSTDTGAANGFKVTSTDGDAAGLSRLAYDPSSSTAGMTRKTAAADAIAYVNNLEIHSASNTFTEAVEGVSFSISKTSSTDLSLDLSADTTSMKSAIDSFVTAYNALNTLVRSNTKINTSDSTQNGTLQGDRTAVNIPYTMRSLLRQVGPQPNSFSTLADIGFNVQLDGSISVNDTKIKAALAKPDALGKLMAGDSSNTTVKGVGKQIGTALDKLLETDGTVTSRTTNLQAALKRNTDQQTRMEDRLTLVEKRLRAQYTALDTTMASLTSLSSYVSQQITSWNSSS